MWQCGKYQLDTNKPIIMGIVNVTPDSFSDGGDFNSVERACAHAKKLVSKGAGIIDVGGESTRPGSDEVSTAEELKRVAPVVKQLADDGIVVSIDTRHADVAQKCVALGAAIINDVSGFRSQAMIDLACECSAGLIIMHMLGEPKHMQKEPKYADVVREVSDYLIARAQMLRVAGVAADRIAIDPGPGFGKNFEHNLALLDATPQLASLGYPLVAAWSRKAFIGQLGAGIANPKDRDALSADVAMHAAGGGAQILRVHNVAATKKAIDNLPAKAIVALGSNMGYANGVINKAIQAIAMLDQVCLLSRSHIYRSEPAYVTDQPVFSNAVIKLATTLKPKQLLHALQELEYEFGRVRLQKNGPRTLDLDIIDFEGECSTDTELLLPHPNALERDFVVTPLLEIDSEYVLADGTIVSQDKVCTGWVFADEQTAQPPDETLQTSILKPTAQKAASGKLAVCATPIGNLGDITKRVIQALSEADVVLAEDTRVTRRLLSHLNLRATIQRCDEAYIRKNADGIIARIKNGTHVAFVSDAGSPCIADPGSVLVRAARESGVKVEVLPGASAVIAAVCAAGFSTAAFYFGGFMPRKSSQIKTKLSKLGVQDSQLVFFESPHRVIATLEVIAMCMPDRRIAYCRELTKYHEEVLVDLPQAILNSMKAREQNCGKILGEIVLVIDSAPKKKSQNTHVDRYFDKASGASETA